VRSRGGRTATTGIELSHDRKTRTEDDRCQVADRKLTNCVQQSLKANSDVWTQDLRRVHSPRKRVHPAKTGPDVCIHSEYAKYVFHAGPAASGKIVKNTAEYQAAA